MAGPPAVEWRDKTEGRIKLGFAYESLVTRPPLFLRLLVSRSKLWTPLSQKHGCADLTMTVAIPFD